MFIVVKCTHVSFKTYEVKSEGYMKDTTGNFKALFCLTSKVDRSMTFETFNKQQNCCVTQLILFMTFNGLTFIKSFTMRSLI